MLDTEKEIERNHQNLAARVRAMMPTIRWTQLARSRINDLHKTLHGLPSDGGAANMNEDARAIFTYEHRRFGVHNHEYRKRTRTPQ